MAKHISTPRDVPKQKKGERNVDMNEPLKFKLFSVYGKLLYREELEKAYKAVKANNGCAGVDKISIAKFDENKDEYLGQILSELKAKTYKPSPVKRKYIPKKNGKLRPLGIPTIKDRIVQQALVNQLNGFFEENVFHDNSCGFRPGRDAKLALKKIVSRLESGYLYVYDFDIKGYFDNIPHKKLMKVLNKYVADGTVLDMIWKWLKAGYMEDNIRHEQFSGTQQGGVISPLLANIYLNELDWELDKAKLEFVRYADDSIVMCQTKEDLERAKEVVHRVIRELGLELAEDKSDDIDFHNKDFDYLGFTFGHLKMSKNNRVYYVVKPSDKSVKKFKADIKAVTGKTCSFSYEKWAEILNPILRGKYNYYLKAYEAITEIRELLVQRNRESHGLFASPFGETDGYVRQRLRVSFSCRGKKHGGIRQSKLLNVKYGNSFFVKDMKLVTGGFLQTRILYPDRSVDEYLEYIGTHKKKRTVTPEAKRFYKLAYAK